MIRTAILNKDETHRFRLCRYWKNNDEEIPNQGLFPQCDDNQIIWVMLNPSIANAERDDATLRRCIDFSKQWGYNGLWIVNLFSQITPNPNELQSYMQNIPASEIRNYKMLKNVINKPYRIVCAWGNNGMSEDRDIAFMNMLPKHRKVYCLKLNKNGTPGHPLYLQRNLELVEYRGRK